MSSEPPQAEANSVVRHRRRQRYSGKHPRHFSEKYKELAGDHYAETIIKVRAGGKTPAGTHVPIMTERIVEVLQPQSAMFGVDCTLGYGGHAHALLTALPPHGKLLGLEVDPVEQPRAEARLRRLGFAEDKLLVQRCNFAGLARALGHAGWEGADFILADLGVSSMQLDNPLRGFALKQNGPLDMRMNARKGLPASQLLAQSSPSALASILQENADEPFAKLLSVRLSGRNFAQTFDLVATIRTILANQAKESQDSSIRRVFQALRIAVNQEFEALDALLRQVPSCLRPGGRVAVLSFHSGEDRRVKKSFLEAWRNGLFKSIGTKAERPAPEECRSNPRASAAKLRWAFR